MCQRQRDPRAWGQVAETGGFDRVGRNEDVEVCAWPGGSERGVAQRPGGSVRSLKVGGETGVGLWKSGTRECGSS